MKILKIHAFILFLLISFNVGAQSPAETIPAFNFYKLDKSPFTNKNLEQDKLLFFVFFDAECDHCQHAVSDINRHYAEFKKTAIYLITLDNQEKIDRFMSKYGQNLKGKKNVTILQDLQNQFITKFRPRKYPALFLYAQDKQLLLYEDNEQNMFRFLNQIKVSVK
jgi:peroxiredoxin